MTFLLLGIILLLLWTTCYYCERALYYRTKKDAVMLENERLTIIARQRLEQCSRLAEMVRDGDAAYQALQHSLQTGGWVRAPSEHELEVGKWN